MNLNPEQFASLRRVLSFPAAKAAAVIPLDPNVFEALFSRIENFVRNNLILLGEHRLLIHHVQGQAGGRSLNAESLNQIILSGELIVAVGDDATIVGSAPGIPTSLMASEESEQMQSVSALCCRHNILLFAVGKIIEEIEIASTFNVQSRSEWKRSWRELPLSFDEHFSRCVENEQNIRYWEDKYSRILLADPDGTEKIFHLSLFWWCANFLNDVIDVYGEAQSMGQDKTDITIITENGNIVVEVKWLGLNVNGMPYAELRIDEGMIQVADYLNRNHKLIKGYLVMYDGRCEEDHKTKSSYNPVNKHPHSEDPIIYFLRSETPSLRAVRIARKQRNAAKAAAKKAPIKQAASKQADGKKRP